MTTRDKIGLTVAFALLAIFLGFLVIAFPAEDTNCVHYRTEIQYFPAHEIPVSNGKISYFRTIPEEYIAVDVCDQFKPKK